jgi:hypothetical protein
MIPAITAQDPGIDRLNTDDVLDIVGFQHRGIGRGQNAFRGEPEVHRQVHDRIADKPAKAATPLFSRASPSGIAIQNITGRKLKAKEPTLLIQMKRPAAAEYQPRQQASGHRGCSRAADPQHDPAKEQRHGQHKVFPNCWKNSHKVIFGAVFAVINTNPDF